jgi:hypothetical protein
MEDTIIALTPAAAQLGICLFLAATELLQYRQTGHTGYLVIALLLCLLLPFHLHRLRTAWRTRAFTTPTTS